MNETEILEEKFGLLVTADGPEEEEGGGGESESEDDGEGEVEDEVEEELSVFDALDDLLASSMREASEKTNSRIRDKTLRENREAAKKRMARGNQSEIERKLDSALCSKVAEALGEWVPVANIGVFRRFNCACGAQQSVFECLMLKQQSGTEKTARRWVQTLEKRDGLPNQVLIREQSVESCGVCPELERDWDLKTLEVWEIAA